MHGELKFWTLPRVGLGVVRRYGGGADPERFSSRQGVGPQSLVNGRGFEERLGQ